MTQSAVQLIEKRFQALRRNVTREQWNDPVFLLKKAEQLKSYDMTLALRVLQRIRNLRPEDEDINNQVKELSNKIKSVEPEAMVSSSQEEVTHMKVVKSVEPEEVEEEPVVVAPLAPKEKLVNFLKTPFSLCVILPFLCFAFYQLIWASPRFESQAQLIVQQPNGATTLDPGLALLSGITGSSSSSDTELVKAYIYSNDMLTYLQDELDLHAHFSSSDNDVFSRLSSSASLEDKLNYYKEHVAVEIDEKSSVISVMVQGYDAQFANRLTTAIVDRAEWYINKIGNDLAKAQLSFVQHEHDLVKQKLDNAKSELLTFQRKYNLLDPEAEGLALQQIAYGLEGQIAAQKAELRSLRSSMSEDAPQVLVAKDLLRSLEMQLEDERTRLTKVIGENTSASQNQVGVNEILARYSEYKIDLEFAIQAYSASQVSMEKSRIEAYRQLKYLVVVEAPTSPDDARYPRVTYNLSLFLVVILMLFGIGKVIMATVEELR